MNPSPGSQRIAVISDGSSVPAGSHLNCVLAGHARWLQSLGFDPRTGELSADDPDALADALSATRDVSIVYLVHTQAERAEWIRQALEGAGRTVVTDSDLRAVVAAAQVLTDLRRTGRPINQSAVVVAGSDELFEMVSLLLAIGVRDLVSWTQADAPALPLARIARDADMVVELRAAPVGDLRTPGQTQPVVIRLPALTDCVAILPGLLVALADTTAGRLGVDVLAAVAQLLATTAVPGSALAKPDPALTDGIAWAARQALRHPRGG